MNATDTKAQIVWMELLSCGNGYSFARDDNEEPFGIEDYEEALQNHLEDKNDHNEQIENGDRDSDDTYEWKLTPVHIQGDMIEILDPDNGFTPISSFNWKTS